ncbi:single-stranded DNA-binding protein [Daejeonella oryzae]|uniref:single-stranded DNA-binding protein n=1 Tax=Daejeonella oryzae TaxID=1122943 RepID=UPI00041B969F|nr:single-stranded DNA-binding protein [Daejeonella oryzae]
MSTLKNSVRLMGFAGNNPEVKIVAENKKVVRLNIATNENYRNSSGEKIEQTQWHSLVFWGKQAEIAEKFIQKGKEISVEGKLTSHSYTAKDGQKKYVTEVLVNEIILLSEKK